MIADRNLASPGTGSATPLAHPLKIPHATAPEWRVVPSERADAVRSYIGATVPERSPVKTSSASVGSEDDVRACF